MEAIPTIKRILRILLPIMFETARSVLPSTLANILITNSGKDVQSATIVSPITIGGI